MTDNVNGQVVEEITDFTDVSSFDDLAQSIEIRVEPVFIGNKRIWVRELSGAAVMDLMKKAPNTIKMVDGTIVTDNATNNMDMGFVCAYAVVRDSTGQRLLKGGQAGIKEWQALPVRVLKPIFEKALDLSDLSDSEEESEGKD